MGPIESIEAVIRNRFNVAAGPALHDRVLARVRQAKELSETAPAPCEPALRRTIMRSPITKLAAAAAVVVAAVLFIGLWEKSAPSVYALEQTLEANRAVRCLHIRNFTTGQADPREGWIEFDADGQAARMRAHMPDWASPVDGAKVLVWKDGTVQVWTKRQNSLTIAKTEGQQEQLKATLQEIDPRLVFARIAELKEQGKVETTIEEPADRTQPITMTVTYLSGSDNPGRRKVLSIDPATKLVSHIEVYQLRESQYAREGWIELQEYNQPIDPRMFDLPNEAPANAEQLRLHDYGPAPRAAQ